MPKNNICRLCEGSEKLELLFNGKNKDVPKKLKEFADVDVSCEDGLPSHICPSCVENLDFSHGFRLMVKLADKNFRETLAKDPTAFTYVEQSCTPVKYEIEYSEVQESEMDVKLENKYSERIESQIIEEVIMKYDDYDLGDEEELGTSFDLNEEDEDEDDKASFEDDGEDAGDEDQEAEMTDNTKIEELATSTWKSGVEKKKQKTNKPDSLTVLETTMDFTTTLERLHVVNYESLENSSDDKMKFCRLCTKAFITNGELKLHEKRFHTVVKCNKCDKPFGSYKTLRNHLTKTHKERPIKPNEEKAKCDICGKILLRTSLAHHLRYTHKHEYFFQECEICNCRVPKNKMRMHLRKHTGERPFVCHICGKSYPRNAALGLHSKTHDKVKDFKCRFCAKSFVQRQILDNHERLHTGEKPFQCEWCGRSFTQKITLNQHLFSVHSKGKKPRRGKTVIPLQHNRRQSPANYKCDLCEKSFAKKQILEQHLRTHSGDRRHSCRYCPASFVGLSSRICHERTHTGDRPYKCETCSKSFAQMVTLKMHERSHSDERPFICVYKGCKKAFKLKNHLQSHKLQHTGERPFVCQHCGKRFSQLSNKNYHERAHTGNFVLKCQFCAKGYNKRRDLANHIEQHHKNVAEAITNLQPI